MLPAKIPKDPARFRRTKILKKMSHTVYPLASLIKTIGLLLIIDSRSMLVRFSIHHPQFTHQPNLHSTLKKQKKKAQIPYIISCFLDNIRFRSSHCTKTAIDDSKRNQVQITRIKGSSRELECMFPILWGTMYHRLSNSVPGTRAGASKNKRKRVISPIDDYLGRVTA